MNLPLHEHPRGPWPMAYNDDPGVALTERWLSEHGLTRRHVEYAEPGAWEHPGYGVRYCAVQGCMRVFIVAHGSGATDCGMHS